MFIQYLSKVLQYRFALPMEIFRQFLNMFNILLTLVISIDLIKWELL